MLRMSIEFIKAVLGSRAHARPILTVNKLTELG